MFYYGHVVLCLLVQYVLQFCKRTHSELFSKKGIPFGLTVGHGKGETEA